MVRIGVISDSHGYLDDRVLKAFQDVQEIWHAGDIENTYVLARLQSIAPVTAVLGNCDASLADWPGLAPVENHAVGGTRILMIHDRGDLGLIPTDVGVVVFGHSHKPYLQRSSGVLWLNPGSAQRPRGSSIGRSVALLDVSEGHADARIVALDTITFA